MPIPELIEIVPLTKVTRARITVPGSKSITNRALILAALAEETTILRGALWSEDTQVMVDCLLRLGFEVEVEDDPAELCNRSIAIKGCGGRIPLAGTAEQPLDLFVGNAGTAARFVAALVCLGRGVYRLHGEPRMHERPQAALFSALRQLGYQIESANDQLPAVIRGRGPVGGRCSVAIGDSSQFASALLLCARVGGWSVGVTGEDAEESPYVAMTSSLIDVFPDGGGDFQIEPDASSGSYFLAANQLAPRLETMEFSPQFGVAVPTLERSRIDVAGWPRSGWQVDEKFRQKRFELQIPGSVLSEREMAEISHALTDVAGGKPVDLESRTLLGTLTASRVSGRSVISRRGDLGDSIMTAMVLAPFADAEVQFTDLGRMRKQECERVAAVRAELSKCGATVVEEGDSLTICPSTLHGAEIETYRDHRMAMCFAILGLKIPGIKLKNPACVKKTFPNFFQKLAAPSPGGLGATILDCATGRPLAAAQLFAA